MGRLIVVVEDEALVRFDLELILEDAGFEVISAGTATSAITILSDERHRLGALVTDIRLGPGASGWDVAEHARRLVPSVAVVYTSGDSASDWEAKGVTNSIMLSKPFASAAVLAALNSSEDGRHPDETHRPSWSPETTTQL